MQGFRNGPGQAPGKELRKGWGTRRTERGKARKLEGRSSRQQDQCHRFAHGISSATLFLTSLS